MSKRIKRDHLAAVRELHERGMNIRAIADVLKERGYFRRKTRNATIDWIRPRIIEFQKFARERAEATIPSSLSAKGIALLPTAKTLSGNSGSHTSGEAHSRGPAQCENESHPHVGASVLPTGVKDGSRDSYIQPRCYCYPGGPHYCGNSETTTLQHSASSQERSEGVTRTYVPEPRVQSPTLDRKPPCSDPAAAYERIMQGIQDRKKKRAFL